MRSSTEAVGFARESDRVVGVVVRDTEDGRETTVRAGVVLNCTGVWTDEIQALSGGRGRFQVRASKGIHIVVPRERITGDAGLILRTAIVGAVRDPVEEPLADRDDRHRLVPRPRAPGGDQVRHRLPARHVNSVLVSPLTHDDILGVYAGLRPLLAGESEETSALSREHAVARVVPGLISIAGGKYTTYRVMAADAVDAASGELLKRVAPSCTDRVPLVGADGYFALREPGRVAGRRVRAASVPGASPARPVRLAVREVLEPGRAEAGLLATVPGAPDYLMAEIRYAVTHEGALHLEDVLTRRTRISIEYPHRGVESAAPVAELLAGVLGWSAERRDAEVADYAARVEAERSSQARWDDAAADAVRTAAPEVRSHLRSGERNGVSPAARSRSAPR